MTFGACSTVLALITLVWVISLIVGRHNICSFWRCPEHDRRKTDTPYNGTERRRCSKVAGDDQGTAISH